MVKFCRHAVILIVSVGLSITPCLAWSQVADTAGLKFKKDDFRGTSSIYTDGIPLSGPADQLSDAIHFGLQQLTEKNGSRSIGIVIEYRGYSWIFIKPGESLLFIVDDSSFSLKGTGSADGRMTISSQVREFAYFEASPAFLRKLQQSKNARIKVVGERLEIEGSLNAEHRGLLNRFLTTIAERSKR